MTDQDAKRVLPQFDCCPCQPAGETVLFPPTATVDAKDGQLVIVKQKIVEYADPISGYQWNWTCTKEAWGDWPWGGQWRTCVSWGLEYRWMLKAMYVLVMVRDDNHGAPVDVKKLVADVESCNQDATQLTLAAAIVDIILGTGGSAAIAAAEKAYISALTACVTSKFGIPALHSVTIAYESRWGDWVRVWK